MSSPARVEQAKDKDESSSSADVEAREERRDESASSTVALAGLALGGLKVAGRSLPVAQVKRELLEEAPNLASVLAEGELDLILAYLENRSYSCTLLSQLYGAAMNLHKEFAQFSAEASNPQTWAVLHRLRGGDAKRGFKDFLQVKAWHRMDPKEPKGLKALNQLQDEWEGPKGKYNPAAYGGGHNWPRNAIWLQQVLGRRVILTDVPLRRSNLMCKVDDAGKPVDGHVPVKHRGAPSAYAREIAALLHDGYVGLWGHELKPTFDQLGVAEKDRVVPLQTFVMVPDPVKYAGGRGNLPPQLYEVLDRRRHVDHSFLNSIVGGAKVLPEDFGQLIGALELAGMPVFSPSEPRELAARVTEANDRQRLAEEHHLRSEQGKLTSTKGAERVEARQRGVENRESKAAASSEILAEGAELAQLKVWLVERLTELGQTQKRFNPSGPDCATLISEGKALGWFGSSFSAASLKRYIKEQVAKLLLPE
jgi:hypothetical protein